MKHIKSYNEFLFEQDNKESDLYKGYVILTDIWDVNWTGKDGAADNFITAITDTNIDTINIDPELPILSQNGRILNILLKEGRVKKENVYNLPEATSKSIDKKKFHEFIGEDENIPKTVFSKEDAETLKFPIIAKPGNGHSGVGISVIKSADELKDLDSNKYNVYSEFIDKAEEHRFINFNGTPIFWMERKAINDKAKYGDGGAEEKMMFNYIKRNIDLIPKDYAAINIKFCEKFKDVPYVCFDIMKGTDNKLYIIESNSSPGADFDITPIVYKNMFEDFYGRDISQEANDVLEKYAKKAVKRTIDTGAKYNRTYIDNSSK